MEYIFIYLKKRLILLFVKKDSQLIKYVVNNLLMLKIQYNIN